MKNSIRITKEELEEHEGCHLEVDIGSASQHGEVPKMQWAIWCKKHECPVGDVLIIKEEGY